MKARDVALFGLSLIAGLSSGFSFGKKKETVSRQSPLFYVGTWQFADPQNNHRHRLEISPDLTLRIDGRKLDTTVKQLDDQALTFLDQFGYELTIRATEAGPVSFFDEADDCTYPIESTIHLSDAD